MRLRRLLALAPVLILALVLAPAARAGNTVWVGVTGTKGLDEAFSGKCFGVSPRLTHTRETVGQIGPPENAFEIRDDGTMKAWTALGYTQAKDNDPPEDPPDASVRFDLLRPYGTSHPTKIAESGAAAYLDGITPNPFTQAVEAGDGFGVALEANPSNEESEAYIGCTAGSTTPFGANNAIWSPPLVSNSGPAPEPEESSEPGYLLEVGAEVEYDAPVITGISPSEGPLNGGTKVTITGEHLRYSSVHLGESDSGKYEDTDGKAVISVPAGRAEGPVDVVVKTAGGTATLSEGFTYGPKETHVETPEEKKAREEEEELEREEECEELEEEGKSCSSGGSGGGGGGGSGETKPPAETPAKPNPGPFPAPAPSGGSSSTSTKFKLPQAKVAKAGGVLSLVPSAPSPGVFHAEGIVVVPDANSRASHTRSVVYGSATAHTKHAGPVSLKLAPGAAAKSLLAKGKALKVHLTVTFTPTSGTKTTRTEVVTVHGS